MKYTQWRPLLEQADPSIGDEVSYMFARSDEPFRYFRWQGRLIEINGESAKVELQFDNPHSARNGTIETVPFDSLYKLDPQ